MTLRIDRSRSDKVDELEIIGRTYIVADKSGMTEKMVYMHHRNMFSYDFCVDNVNEDRGDFTVYSEFRLSFCACNCLITRSCSTTLSVHSRYDDGKTQGTDPLRPALLGPVHRLNRQGSETLCEVL